MPTPDADIAVLGAGPAGTIAARELTRSGLSVVLIDPGAPSIGHRIESFPASGGPLAEALGLLETLCAISEGPAAEIHMLWRDAPELRDFGDEGPLLIDRNVLRGSLLELAKAEGGRLRVQTARARGIRSGANGCEVDTNSGTVTARCLIDARGRRGTDRSTDLVALPFAAQSPARTKQTMHLEAFSDGWLWASTLRDGTVNGAVFLPPSGLAGKDSTYRRAVVAGFLNNSAMRVSELLDVGRPRGAGMSAAADPVPAPRHMKIGDAALARDPIASHGLIHAMRSATQAAAAARTILDRDGDNDAAVAFLRLKHHQNCHAAAEATSRAYADQSRFKTSFWAERGHWVTGPKSSPPKGELKLAHPLDRAPVLDGDRIRWVPAIALPNQSDVLITYGPLSAVEIAAASRPSASLPELARRLGKSHPANIVQGALDTLIAGGALVQTVPTR